MSLVKIKSDWDLIPRLASDFLTTDFLERPSMLDFDSNLMRFGLSANFPSVNIIENTKDFRIEMAAPGLEKKDFKIEVDNGMLCISSEKEEERKEEGENFQRREFTYRGFSRTFQLPENSVPDKIDAKYDQGVLKLVLPKKEVTLIQPKKEIKVD
jgi:HSP20 family protein